MKGFDPIETWIAGPHWTEQKTSRKKLFKKIFKVQFNELLKFAKDLKLRSFYE